MERERYCVSLRIGEFHDGSMLELTTQHKIILGSFCFLVIDNFAIHAILFKFESET